MITPNRFRSCHPRPGVSKAVPGQFPEPHRDRRMREISDLERKISALEIPELGYSTISDHAAVHVLGSTTMAIVILCEHNARIIERVIRAQHYGITDIRIAQDIITIAL